MNGQPPSLDRAAMTRLYAAEGPKIVRHALRWGLSPDEAEELLHTVFDRAWAKRAEHIGDNPACWLWGFVRLVLHEQLRQKRSRARHVPLEPDKTADGDNSEGVLIHPALIEQAEMIDPICIQKAFERFAKDHPDRARAIQFVVEGWSNEEISRFLDRSQAATRQYLSQCRIILAPYLRACSDCDPPVVTRGDKK